MLSQKIHWPGNLGLMESSINTEAGEVKGTKSRPSTRDFGALRRVQSPNCDWTISWRGKNE